MVADPINEYPVKHEVAVVLDAQTLTPVPHAVQILIEPEVVKK